MNEQLILQTILLEMRRLRVTPPEPRSPHHNALMAAARRIASDADTERRQAARTASVAGYAVTRGRTHL